jgi:hypothetical protein
VTGHRHLQTAVSLVAGLRDCISYGILLWEVEENADIMDCRMDKESERDGHIWPILIVLWFP